MSSAGRGPRGGGGTDWFPTPAWPVHRFLEDPYCPLSPVGHWIEPFAGDGALVKAVNGFDPGRGYDFSPSWTVCELLPRFEPDLAALPLLDLPPIIGDFFDEDFGDRPFDVAISNPPYTRAAEAFIKALQVARKVAFLMRVGILESEERNGIMRACPPDVFLLPNRPNFDGWGTDSTPYAWHCWDGENLERPFGMLRVLACTDMAIRKAQMPSVPLPRPGKEAKKSRKVTGAEGT